MPPLQYKIHKKPVRLCVNQLVQKMWNEMHKKIKETPPFPAQSFGSRFSIASVLLLGTLPGLHAEPLAIVVEKGVEKPPADKPSLTSEVTPWHQSQQVLNQSLLQDTQEADGQNFALYLPNIQMDRLGAGTGEDFTLRGFNTGGRLLLDGMLDNQNYYVRDSATVERIEFIKGHNSVLYGAGAPGGSVNYLSKKPQYDTARSLTLTTGNFDYKRLVLDATGPVNEAETAAWRSILVLQDADTWKDNVSDRRYVLMNSLEFRYQDFNHLRATWEYSQQHYPYDFDNVFAQGRPVFGTSYVHPDTRAKRTFNRLELDWRHRISSQSWLEGSARYITGSRDEDQIGFFFMANDTQPLIGFYQLVDETFEQYTGRLAWNQAYRLGEVDNLLSMGLGVHTTDTRYDNRRSTGAFSLDIYNPRFDFDLPAGDQLLKRQGYFTWDEYSIFIQQETQLTPSLMLTLGSRYSDYKLHSWFNEIHVGQTENTHRTSAAGLSWKVQDSLHLYGSYSESWLPNSGLSKEGYFFDPSQGRQSEVGIRLEPVKNLTMQLALYRITQDNLLVRDPDAPAFRILAGEKRVKGSELQMQWQAAPTLSVSATAGMLDSMLRRSFDANEGNAFPGAPRKTASVLMAYQPAVGISTYMGAVYQSKRPGDLANSFHVDSFIRYDAGLSWQIKPTVRANVSVRNITDRQYVSYAVGDDFLRFGDPRTLRAGLTLAF